jgi:hypothetical protein
MTSNRSIVSPLRIDAVTVPGIHGLILTYSLRPRSVSGSSAPPFINSKKSVKSIVCVYDLLCHMRMVS